MASVARNLRIPRDVKPRHVATVQYPGNGVLNGLAAITRTRLPVGEVLADLNLILNGLNDIVGFAGVLSPEQPMSLIRDIQIVASSRSRPEVGQMKQADGPAFYQLQTFMKGTQGLVVLAAGLVGVDEPFSCDYEIDFELARAIDPRMTLLNTIELNPSSFDLVVQWEDVTGVMTAGAGGTVTPHGVTLDVVAREYTDDITKAARYGINKMRFMEYPIPAVNARLPIDIKGGYFSRGVVIKQFTRAAGVNWHTPVITIINSVIVELNRTPKVNYPTWAQLVAENKYTYGMTAADLPMGYALVDFMPEGKPDTLIDTRVVDSLELVLNVNFVANGFIRLYPLEIIPITGR